LLAIGDGIEGAAIDDSGEANANGEDKVLIGEAESEEDEHGEEPKLPLLLPLDISASLFALTLNCL